jgi:hypothetical protein
MIFVKKKKLLGWCDDPPKDRVISIFAGCHTNHDRAHIQVEKGKTIRSPSSLLVFLSMILLQQKKKSREPGKKCHAKTVKHNCLL